MKRALIANYSLVEYAGSEINTFYIAKELKKQGFEVEIVTFNYGYPIKNLFDKEKLIVLNLFDENEEIKNKNYDLLWCHHTPTLYSLIYNFGIEVKKIIFQSLSPFMELEVIPYFYQHLSMVLTNSQETKEKIIEEINMEKIDDKIIIFPNFIPSEYFNKNEKKYKLKSVVVISNHLCDEILETIDLLEKNGIKTMAIGKEKIVKFVDKELLSSYDLVISIGKTVQYCFGASIPVYCYDYFGGPGYINKNNLSKAEKLNFSGRGFRRHTSEEIYRDIIDKYDENQKNLDFFYEYSKKNFSLEKNLLNILIKLENMKVTNTKKIRENFPLIYKHNNYFLNELKNNLYYKKRNNLWNFKTRLFIEQNNEWIEQLELQKDILFENNILTIEYHSTLPIQTSKILINPVINKFIKCKIIDFKINGEEFLFTNLNAVKIDAFDSFISIFPFYELKLKKKINIKSIFLKAEVGILDIYEAIGMSEKIISSLQQELDKNQKIIIRKEEIISKILNENIEVKKELNFILNSKYWKMILPIRRFINILRRR